MAEYKMVAVIGRRFRDGKEEVQVQWAVTWEPVNKQMAAGQLYQEYMADLKADAEAETEVETAGRESEDEGDDGKLTVAEGTGVSTRGRRAVRATGTPGGEADPTTEAAGPEKRRSSGSFPALPRPTKK